MTFSHLQTTGFVCAAAVVVAAFSAFSTTPAKAEPHVDLIEALRIQDTVTIMRKEGLGYAGVLGEEMLGEDTGAGWSGVVSKIYDVDKMTAVITEGLSTALAEQDVTEVTAFFASELGQEIVMLELAAREAMVDEDTEEAAIEAFETARDAASWQYTQVQSLIEDSDLVEFNVVGALNSNFAFYRGLADGDALEMSESEMLADVATQESDIRNDSAEWLGAYLFMAYQSLSQEQLETYAELYRSDQGQAVNAAIFQAYDQMYEELSYLLGRAVADQMRGQDL